MARYWLAQPIRLFTTTSQIDVSGNYTLANAGTLSLTIAKPDGSQQTYSSPTNDAQGKYHQDVPASDLTQLGHYQFVWTSTGTAAGVSVGEFDVDDPFTVNILALQDAKDMLNIPQATTTYDTEILGWIYSIQSGLERFTGGPIITRNVTERAEAVNGMRQIILRQRPVVSVVSITAESGGAVSITDIVADPNSGIIQRTTGWPIPGPFLFTPWFSVVYKAGWGTSVPPAFDNFARIVIDHNWELQRMPVSLPMSSEEAVSVPGFSFLVPRRAYELLNGSQNGIPFIAEAVV